MESAEILTQVADKSGKVWKAKGSAPGGWQDPDAPAVFLMAAARRKLGASFLAYEPETLWLELDPIEHNRDKLAAAMALGLTPSFYWDYRVFGNTVLAFNDLPVSPDEVPNPTAAHIAWGLFEGELIFSMVDGETTPHFDDEVAAYAATNLHEEGFVLAPTFLEFCQPHLDKMTSPEFRELKEQVSVAWAAHPRGRLEETSFENSPLGVQLARLAEVELYLVSRAERTLSWLNKL